MRATAESINNVLAALELAVSAVIEGVDRGLIPNDAATGAVTKIRHARMRLLESVPNQQRAELERHIQAVRKADSRPETLPTEDGETPAPAGDPAQ